MKLKSTIKTRRVYNRVKRMCMTALFLGTVSWLGQNYVTDSLNSFIAGGNDYSGLYVNADQLGMEGERLL